MEDVNDSTSIQTFLELIAKEVNIPTEEQHMEITNWKNSLGKYTLIVQQLKVIVNSSGWIAILLDPLIRAIIEKRLSQSPGEYLSVNSILDKTTQILNFPFDYVERDCFRELQKAILCVDPSLGRIRQVSRKVIQIYGIRGSGKTTIIVQAMRWLVADNSNLKHLVVYMEIVQTTPGLVLQEKIKNFIDRNVKYVFVDEIQRVSEWQSVLINFALFDIQFIVAGSQVSAFNSSTLLVGRHTDVHVMPYSFREFGRALQSLRLEHTQLFDHYLKWGGFPIVVNKLKKYLTGPSSDEDIISTLYDLYKDIVKIDCYPLLSPSGEKLILTTIARNLFSQSPKIEILQALEKIDMIKITENQHQCLCIDTGLYNAVKKKLDITEVNTNIRTSCK